MVTKILIIVAALLVGALSVGAQADDGRVNPLPAAPVAIYCNWNTIDVYVINPWNGKGELTLSMTFDEIYADAQAGAEVAWVDGVRLSFTNDWAYKVEFPQADGTIYQFWWWNCPISYGEEYIYDPATGVAQQINKVY